MRSISRRDWLLAAACWTQVLRAQTATQPFEFFDAAQAAEIDAIAETILPADPPPH